MAAYPSASLLALLLVLGCFRAVQMTDCTVKVEECLQAYDLLSTPGKENCGIFIALEKCFDRLVKEGTCWSITVGANSKVISLRMQHISCSEKTGGSSISATHKVSSILLVVSLTVAVVFALRPRL